MAKAFDRRTSPSEMLSHRKAWRVDDCQYQVCGRDGHRYDLSLQSDGELSCNCPAGIYGQPTCWHRATVSRRLLREGLPDLVFQPDLSVVESDELQDEETLWPPAS
ncbi:MAG: hypothetical protein DLM66_12860 [Candidatus Dormiibacter spiritus]|nr:MAG: hypothetical protein DLM66_12860 [Candidatus Dormibacteraeota bacterium]